MTKPLFFLSLLMVATLAPAQGASSISGPFGNPATIKPCARLVLNESFGSAKNGATVTQIGTGSAETDLLKRWMFGQNGWLGSAGKNIAIQARGLFIRLAYDATPVPPGFDNSGKPSGWGDALQLTSEMARKLALIPTRDDASTYLEVREKLPKSPEAWPDIWLYCNHDDYRAGKNSGDSELDVLETNVIFYRDQIFRPEMFVSTSHTLHAAMVEQKWIQPGPARLSDDFHVYGCEIYRKNGQIYWNIFFDGKWQFGSKKDWKWTSPPPTLILGGGAVVKPGGKPSVPDDGTSLDWVRVWRS
jgi:hypothetical protein